MWTSVRAETTRTHMRKHWGLVSAGMCEDQGFTPYVSLTGDGIRARSPTRLFPDPPRLQTESRVFILTVERVLGCR